VFQKHKRVGLTPNKPFTELRDRLVFQKHKVGHVPCIATAFFFGAPGLLIGLLLGAALRRAGPIGVALGVVLAAYLALAWFTAPETHEGCGNECYEWHGRYGEWGLVAIFVVANTTGLLLGAAAGAAIRAGRSGRRA
jgi:hypothetical protein